MTWMCTAGGSSCARTLNVPLDGSRITDDGKIRACPPTLNALLDRGAAVVVCSHLGRPAARRTPPIRWRRSPRALASCWAGSRCRGRHGRAVRAAAVADLAPGGVVMLENLRFNAGETSKDDALRGAFADDLAAWPSCTSAIGSGPCIAGMPAPVTCPRGFRTPPGT